jgi:hypothetical protein
LPVISRPLAIAITILVALVWAGSVTVGLLYPNRGDLSGINTIFAIVLGAAFGLVPKRETLAGGRRRLAQLIGGDEPPPAEEPTQESEQGRGDSA